MQHILHVNVSFLQDLLHCKQVSDDVLERFDLQVNLGLSLINGIRVKSSSALM